MAVIADKCPEILVTVYDINKSRIDAWNSQQIPILEPGLAEIVQRTRGKNLKFTTDLTAAIENASIIFEMVREEASDQSANLRRRL